jgi:hypothetical protein
MARTLQAAALPRIEARQVPAVATLAALGIVYGDIGTSALYGFKQAADAAGATSPEAITGIVSVILPTARFCSGSRRRLTAASYALPSSLTGGSKPRRSPSGTNCQRTRQSRRSTL